MADHATLARPVGRRELLDTIEDLRARCSELAARNTYLERLHAPELDDSHEIRELLVARTLELEAVRPIVELARAWRRAVRSRPGPLAQYYTPASDLFDALEAWEAGL